MAPVGVTFDYLDRLEEALAAIDTALGLDPVYVDAWVSRGVVLAHGERWEEAVQAYTWARDLYPDDSRI